MLDVLSVLPTDLAFLYFGIDCHEQVIKNIEMSYLLFKVKKQPFDFGLQIPCPVVVRLNRVIRVDRLFTFFKRTETRTSSPNGFRMLKIIFYIVIINHWNASLFFAISFYIGFESDGWVYRVRLKKQTIFFIFY